MNKNSIKALEKSIASDYENIAGIVIQKDGVIRYERYFHGYTESNALHVYSVTKSVFSALIGIAIDRGYIRSIDQKILEYFPNYVPTPGNQTIRDITIRHLLTMTAPYQYETEPFEAYFSSGNWVKAALDYLGGAGPIGEFTYSAVIGTHVLSGVLANAIGASILDFAEKHLFSPLEMSVPGNVFLNSREEHLAFGDDRNARGWVADQQGINTASWGLCLTPRDMAKFGQLYRNNGVWGGRQIVPAAWVEESTREHSRWVQQGLPYGYLWWILNEKKRIYAAMGDGGNIIYINSSKQLVVAIASLFIPKARERIGLIKKYVEPAFAD